MKKILSLFLIFFFLSITRCVAVSQNYQYRDEINKVIKKQILYSKKQINNVYNDVKKENNKYIKNNLVEQGINSILLEFYISLANITDKYFDISKDIPNTDWYEDVKMVVDPYLKNNRADMSKVNSFLKYANKKQKEIKKTYLDN